MMHYLLFYEAGEDYEERRKPFRAAHLQHGRAAAGAASSCSAEHSRIRSTAQ